MKRLVVRLVLSVLMSVLCFSVAQAAITYPLQLSAHILPPYGCRLSDYVVQGMERLNLTVLQRDLRYSNYDFLVRMQVKQGTKIVISSTAGYTVKSGQLTRLNSANLFNGLTADITAQDKYKENGFCLNEGAYEFVFQAFDAKNTALPVSEPVYFHTYLSKALPPACVFPANGSCVDYKSAAVNFAWLEKSVSMPSNGKRYSLEVYEMPEGFDGTDRAENLAGASEPVYRKDDINGNITVHTAPISAGMFIKGRTYVWRVRSYSADFGQADSRVSGHVENNGYSQYSAFKFGTCVDVEDVWKKKDQAAIGAVKYDSSKKPVLESVDTSGAVAVVEWLHEPEKFCGYVVEWNMADTALAPWGQKIVSEKDSFAYISGLSYGVDYIVRLRGVICNGSEEQAYSACADNVLSFRLEKREDAECGNPVPQVTSLVSLKEAMKEGDVLSANGHDVTVLTCEMNVSGSDTTFTGTGLVSYGFLKSFFNLTVKFDNVKINDRKELLQGMVYANTDLNNCLDLNLNRLANKGSAGSGPAQRQTAKFDEFSSADNIPENKAGLAGGTMYAWDADGNRVECGTLEDTSCASNNLFVDSRHGEVLFDNLEGMEWNPPFDREKRPFDRNLTFSDYYENLDGYSVPWIGVPEGGTTKVKATLLQGASVNPNDVHFVLRTGSQSIRLNAKRIDGNSSVATYEVPVFADKAGDKGAYLELSAVVSTGEGACSQQLVLGVAKVYALKREHFNVRIVPCHNVSIDEDAIAKKLNEIYKPLGKTFTVTEDELFYGDSAFVFIADTFDVKNISRRSTETEDMAFLKYIYREERGFSKDSVYLFVLPKANIDGVTGFMPRGKHGGYLFCGENETIDERTVAHELGHGLFTLEHAFDYIDGSPVGSTNNLMDYSDGANLKVWQWNHMDTHGPVLPFFDDAEDAMSICYFVDIYYWFGTKLDGLCPDYKERIVDNRMTYFDYVESNIFKMSSSLGEQYGYTNKEGKCMRLPKSDEISEDWTVCYGRKFESVLSEIHKGNSVKLQEMKKQFIYIFVEHCDILGEDVFTKFALHVFKNSPTLSQYKVKSLDDLANNQRVKAAFQECYPYYFLISFFDENGDLSAVLQMTDILFYKGAAYKDDAKKRSEEWVKHLLLENNKNNTNDGTANTEEYKEPQQQPDRYIVSDAQAVIRGENGYPLDGDPTISQGTEVKDVEFVTKTVEGKDVECAKVTLVGTESEQVLYTAAINLTKIEVLEKPEDAGFIFGNSVKLPYSIAPTGETHDLKDEFEIIARCGDYVRIASSSLKESGKNSEGFWINSKNITLTVSEIAEIRAEIAKMPTNTAEEKAAKEQAYLDLQWVVPYHSQRDNNTLDTVRHIITYVYDEKGKEIETKHSNFQTLDGKHSWSYDKCSKKGHANPCPNELKENVKAKIFWTTTNWVQKEKITYHKDAKGVNTDKIKEKEVTMYYKGKPGDIMCNLTSTAMNLTYLGLSKNDFDYTICPECSTRCSSNDQLEDFLDCVRKTKKMDSRLGYSTWRKLAELFGVSMTTKYSDPQKFNALNNQTFINEINGYLSSGKSIQMAVWPGCKGHIVRLVAISTEGIVVDDPYGDVIRTKTCGKKTPRQTGFMHRQSCNSGGYNKNTNSQSSIVGKHNLWKWDEIKDVTCKGIFIFDK